MWEAERGGGVWQLSACFMFLPLTPTSTLEALELQTSKVPCTVCTLRGTTGGMWPGASTSWLTPKPSIHQIGDRGWVGGGAFCEGPRGLLSRSSAKDSTFLATGQQVPAVCPRQLGRSIHGSVTCQAVVQDSCLHLWHLPTPALSASGSQVCLSAFL